MTNPDSGPQVEYLAEGLSVALSLENVAKIVAWLREQDALDDFVTAAEAASAHVSIAAATVNFVKGYVRDRPKLAATPFGAVLLKPTGVLPPPDVAGGGTEARVFRQDSHTCKLGPG